MAKVQLKHVERLTDRHGRLRYYFRRGHGKRTALPGEPGSPEFMTAYHAAMRAPDGRLAPAGKSHGSVAALVDAYFASPDFLRCGAAYRASTRAIVERFAAQHGHRPVAQMDRAIVNRLIGEKAETPAGANNLLKRLRILMHFAIANGYRTDDPTIGIKKFREGEHHTWTEAEIAQFEAHWPLGSRERTAFALHLYVGQRRGDVCKMTWADIENGAIRIVQGKTGEVVFVPIHEDLSRVLDAWPKRHFTIIPTGQGRRYTVESYGNLMADAINKAGLPKRCVLHGLRKSAARRLAEAGCSAHEIAAVTGHRTIGQTQHYTRMADRKRLASAAILRLSKKG